MSVPVADINEFEENPSSVGDVLTSEELVQMKELLHSWDENGDLSKPEEVLLACLREKQRGIRSPGYICEDGHYTPDRGDLVHFQRTKRGLGALLPLAVNLKMSQQCSGENKEILQEFGLFDKWLMRDKDVQPSIEKIAWTQFSRCWWMCEEEYYLVDYHVDGDKESPVIKVFVAKSVLSPPDGFSTLGDYERQLLHFGVSDIEEFKSIFFVLHPRTWEPFQHRFMTDTYREFIQYTVTAAGGRLLFSPLYKIGLTLLITGPQLDDYAGNYLCYVGE